MIKAEGEVFFDSWGNPWITCSCYDLDAQAFGPTGLAKPINIIKRQHEFSEFDLFEENGWTYLDSR